VEAALQHASALFRALGTPPYPLPLPGGSRDFDAVFDDLGANLGAGLDSAVAGSHAGNWVLATILYETGGHTAVIRDLALALPDGLSGLVVTLAGFHPSRLTPSAAARTGLSAEAVHQADAPTFVGTCEHVLRVFRDRPPKRLFLLHNPDDVAAVVAASVLASTGTEIWLVHHADALPSSGLFLRGAKIIDLTPRACAFTRYVMGLETIFLPLTCPDPGPVRTGFLYRGRLRTALAGSAFKVSQTSVHSYPKVLAEMLNASGGTHVHIGPLAESQIEAIGAALDAHAIHRSRFVHVPVARTLVDALRDERVDLLINTWPYGGARTVVEAMAAGVPVVWHSPQPGDDLTRLHMAWPGAPVWRHLSDLTDIVRGADASWLEAQAAAARRRYETRHHPSFWRQFFASPDASPGLPLPDAYDASMFASTPWSDLLHGAVEIADPVAANPSRR
jgi:hypothetical protein